LLVAHDLDGLLGATALVGLVPDDERHPVRAGLAEGVLRPGRHLGEALAEVPEPLDDLARGRSGETLEVRRLSDMDHLGSTEVSNRWGIGEGPGVVSSGKQTSSQQRLFNIIIYLPRRFPLRGKPGEGFRLYWR
jgi:hypothetical protein